MKPRKPTLSPSKITTYLACPSRYHWTYLDERGRWYLKSKSVFSFGTTLHHVLQRFHDAGDQGVQTVEQAMAAVEESWIEAGYRSAQEMQEAMSEGKAILAAYVERELVGESEAQTLFVEKQLRADLGPFVLLGRLDRIDEYPDGTLEVIDYKSGRDSVSDEDVANDLAMACYQLLVQTNFPDRAVKATIIALRSGARATAQMSPEDLAQFKDDLIALGQEILGRDYEHLVPVPKRLCLQCDFLPLCSKHEDWDADAIASLRSGDAPHP